MVHPYTAHTHTHTHGEGSRAESAARGSPHLAEGPADLLGAWRVRGGGASVGAYSCQAVDRNRRRGRASKRSGGHGGRWQAVGAQSRGGHSPWARSPWLLACADLRALITERAKVGSHSHRVTHCPVQCRGQQHSIAAHTLPCGCLSLLSRPQPGIRQHIVPCLARRSRHLPLQRCVLVEWQLVWLILIPLWLLQRSRQQGWETDSAATRAATNRARVG